MNVTIYALSCPITGALRYVGKTVDAKHRIREHIKDKRKTRKGRWVQSLLESGLHPVMETLEVIENSDDHDWQDAERFWISYLRFMGCNLTNLDSGGMGGMSRSEETKLKISNANAYRKPRTPESRLKTSLALMGRKRPGWVREIISKAKQGQKYKPRSAEHRAKLGAIHRGKIVSDETRAKQSASAKRRWLPG